MTATTSAEREAQLLYSEIEEEVRGTVRRVLTDRCSWQSVLSRVDAAVLRTADGPEEAVPATDLALWQSVGTDLGLAALPVPEELGGAGAGWPETAVVLEELGRSVAPVPFLGTAVAAATLLALPASAVRDEALGFVTAGDATTLVVPFSTPAAAPGDAGVVTVADGADGAGVLSGTVTSVADAFGSEQLLVRTADGLWLVATGQDGVTLRVLPSLDPTRPLTDVVLERASGRRLGGQPESEAAVAAGVLAAAGLLASEQLGVATWCLEETVSYLRTRHQFGRLIGSYQGLKHRLADLWVEVTQAKAVARYAVDCLATGDPDTAVAVSLAQAHCSPLAVKAAEECVQMHGGIGFTWEHPAHLYLKRAKADAIAYGTAEHHRQAIASLVGLPPA